ncbi:hypothetical protein MUK42_07168 [Musa troglodytarum]|uniref:Uncharacterized protein n=1 Tax=Musa troglodytarum TaxID=320322 RepID=A0A9E7KLJ7_9LILI|nr:hypothetical protein MUK42_07168 [Musa troglodytarum]
MIIIEFFFLTINAPGQHDPELNRPGESSPGSLTGGVSGSAAYVPNRKQDPYAPHWTSDARRRAAGWSPIPGLRSGMSSASIVVLSGFGLGASDFPTETHMSSRPWIASACSQSISVRCDRLRPRGLPGLRDTPHQGHRQEQIDLAILNSKGWQRSLLQPSRKMNFIICSVVLEKYVVRRNWKQESMQRTRKRGKAPYGLQRVKKTRLTMNQLGYPAFCQLSLADRLTTWRLRSSLLGVGVALGSRSSSSRPGRWPAWSPSAPAIRAFSCSAAPPPPSSVSGSPRSASHGTS